MSCAINYDILFIINLTYQAAGAGIFFSIFSWRLFGMRHRKFTMWAASAIVGFTQIALVYIVSCFSLVVKNTETGAYGVMGEYFPTWTVVAYFCVSAISFVWCDNTIKARL